MADNVIEPILPVVENNQPTVSEQIASSMAIALGGGIIPAEQQPDAAVITPVITPEPAVFEFKTFTEKYGWQTPDDAAKEIEELRNYKATPIVEQPKFDNEFNEKLYKAIHSGQIKEVTQLLAQQDRLESLTTAEVTKDTAADIIKLGMQLEFKTLTPAEIDYKYNKNFAIPKEPVQDMVNESDDDFALRKGEWQEKVTDIEMGKMIEAKMAIPKLQAAKAEIKLPDITATIDQDYVQWQKLMDEQSKLNDVIAEQYKNITPKDVELRVPFNDEANKIAFEFQYEPDADSFKVVAEMATDVDKFLKSFVSNGQFDKAEFLRAVHFAKNRNTIITAAINQSKNATIKSTLPDNDTGGLQRQLPLTHEPTELDKQMRRAGVV